MTTPCHCFPSVRGGRNPRLRTGPRCSIGCTPAGRNAMDLPTPFWITRMVTSGIKSAAIRIEGDNAYGYLKVSMAFTGWCGYPPLTPMPGGRFWRGGDHPGAGRQRGGRYTPLRILRCRCTVSLRRGRTAY